LRGGYTPLFSEKRLEDIENKENERAKREACWKFEVGGWRLEGRRSSLRAGLEAGDDESSRAEARGLRAAGAKFETREAGNLETRLAGTECRSTRVAGRFAKVMSYFTV
jgi:hypothetical protein